jgi:hypothetical protein
MQNNTKSYEYAIMKSSLENACYRKFISLFSPSPYPPEKRIRWATYLYCRLLCYPEKRSRRNPRFYAIFHTNLSILYLAFMNDLKRDRERNSHLPGTLTPSQRKQMKRILRQELQ